MPMTPFYSKFPELAVKETRTVGIREHRVLPDGEYGFLELYCDEDDCDCRRVLLFITSTAAGNKTLATISYGWEDSAFYRKRYGYDKEAAKLARGASLDLLNEQTEYSKDLLKFFRSVLMYDEAYVDRLKRHYRIFKGKLWTIDGIMNDLELSRGYFPEDAINFAVVRKEEITPRLLAVLDRLRTDAEALDKSELYIAHLYSMFLLAQFREPKAYPLLVEFLHLPGDITERLLGDTVADGLCRILASLCGGNIVPVQGLIEDPKANEWVRGSAIRSLNVLLFEGLIERHVVVDYHRHLLTGGLERQHSQAWNALVNCATDVHPGELLGEITKAYKDGLVDDMSIRLKDVEEASKRDLNLVLEDSREGEYNDGLIDDTVYEMGWWACFEQKGYTPLPDYFEDVDADDAGLEDDEPLPLAHAQGMRKIAGNDYCPCGSGRKYKKCCGQPASERK